MIEVVNYDFRLRRGARYERTIIVKDSEGVAIDLTGREAKLTVKPRYSSEKEVLVLTSEPAAGLTLTHDEGKIALVITSEQSEALPLDFFGEVKIEVFEDPDLDQDRVLGGFFYVEP